MNKNVSSTFLTLFFTRLPDMQEPYWFEFWSHLHEGKKNLQKSATVVHELLLEN